MFKTLSNIYTEIAREYGIIALRFMQTHERKISPEQCAKEVLERQEKIKVLKDQFNKLIASAS